MAGKPIRRTSNRNPARIKSFLCQVETYFGSREYVRQGSCVRLIGVAIEERSALASADGDGVTTFVFELDYWRFFGKKFGVEKWWDVAKRRADIEALEEALHGQRQWFKVDVDPKRRAADYYYQTFSDSDPIYFELLGVEATTLQQPGGAGGAAPPEVLMAATPAHWAASLPADDPYEVEWYPGDHVLRAFHVGQGMCSLVDNGEDGILLDAGAGKPITRRLYLDKAKPLRNDLAVAVKRLSGWLLMIASHTDYDHWKLLAWDPALLERVATIAVPDGVNHLLFKDRAIIDKCHGVSSMRMLLGSSASLTVLRSKPATVDANGDCLVAVFERSNHRALIPGDYVYSRMNSDGSTRIARLRRATYDVVIVPHHGDKASASDVFRPASETAQAFFSAGTHQGYKHPTEESLDAHDMADFVRLCENDKPYIKEMLRL